MKKKGTDVVREEREQRTLEKKSNLQTKCWIFSVALLGSYYASIDLLMAKYGGNDF